VCLVRFAFANIRRRPERFTLSVLGIALAIACVTVVRTISASFAITGADSVTDVLGGAQLWAVPAAGVHFDADAQALVANGPAPAFAAPDGWRVTRTMSGLTEINGQKVSLRGRDETPSGQAILGSGLADRLGVQAGDRVVVGGQSMIVDVAGGGQSMTVATPLAQSIVGSNGWWLVFAPPGDEKRRDLGQTFGDAVGLKSTSDPSVAPDPKGQGLIYDTVGGSGPLTFEQKFSALFSGKVTSSTLGLISIIGLGLGFVIAVSSFLAAVQERRREFGIMSSIGLADEVLYFFLVESAIVFIAAYIVGVLGAGAAVALVIPGIATPTAWLQACGMVAAFLPAMAIVGALVPVHRLLQQRPVDLLGDR
jgi:putative ABC transport system permease protein